MSLNTRTEPMDNRRLSLIVEVDQERVDRELRKAARTVGRQYRIPGFRKGKAPYNVVVQHVGLPNLYSEFLDSLGNEVYAEAVKQEQIEPYAMASLDISTLEPLVYEFEIPLEPTVDLGDYRSLRVEEEEPEVTEEEIEEILKDLLTQHAGWTKVDRPSQYGDMVTIDVKSVLAIESEVDESAEASDDDSETSEDGETVVLDETDWDVMLDEENPMEPPGLDQELLGMSAGDEKRFTLTWPEDSQSMYAGKKANFHVTVHEVQANMDPELDDKFAKEVNEEFETVEDLRADVSDNILESKKAQADRDYLDLVLDTLVEQSEMDYPPVVVEDQIDSMVDEFSRQLRMYGIESLEAYLSQIGQSMEEYRENLREQAEIAARRNLVISEVYQLEGITVTEDEVEERIAKMEEDMGGEGASEQSREMMVALAESMRNGPGRRVLESQIIQEKTLERLLAIARGEEVPEPAVAETEADVEEHEAAEDESSAAPLEATLEATAEAREDAGGEAAADDDTAEVESAQASEAESATEEEEPRQ